MSEQKHDNFPQGHTIVPEQPEAPGALGPERLSNSDATPDGVGEVGVSSSVEVWWQDPDATVETVAREPREPETAANVDEFGMRLVSNPFAVVKSTAGDQLELESPIEALASDSGIKVAPPSVQTPKPPIVAPASLIGNNGLPATTAETPPSWPEL